MKCETESVKCSTLRHQVLVYNRPIEFTLVNETILFACEVRCLKHFIIDK